MSAQECGMPATALAAGMRGDATDVGAETIVVELPTTGWS